MSFRERGAGYGVPQMRHCLCQIRPMARDGTGNGTRPGAPGTGRIVASICAAFLIIHLICIRLPEQQAQALIAFGGDAGSLVLGSFLMAMIYEPAFVENSLRWGFLGIGAATFVRTYVLWAGPEANIPFGVRVNGVIQDGSALVEKYGWTIQTMIQRYVRLGEGCLTVLAIVYVWRIHETRAEIRSHPTT